MSLFLRVTKGCRFLVQAYPNPLLLFSLFLVNRLSLKSLVKLQKKKLGSDISCCPYMPVDALLKFQEALNKQEFLEKYGQNLYSKEFIMVSARLTSIIICGRLKKSYISGSKGTDATSFLLFLKHTASIIAILWIQTNKSVNIKVNLPYEIRES